MLIKIHGSPQATYYGVQITTVLYFLVFKRIGPYCVTVHRLLTFPCSDCFIITRNPANTFVLACSYGSTQHATGARTDPDATSQPCLLLFLLYHHPQAGELGSRPPDYPSAAAMPPSCQSATCHSYSVHAVHNVAKCGLEGYAILTCDPRFR